MKNLIILNSHPIQYFVPLYQKMNEDKGIRLTVLFCSDFGANEYFDQGFGRSVKWDIPLLSGFNYLFLKNHSFKGSINKGFWGVVNLGIINYLWNSPKSTIIIFGWNYATNIIAIIFGVLLGHKVCMRCDIPIRREFAYYNRFKRILRKIIFKYILFPNISYFLYIGKQNKLFYKKYGVPERKLKYSPFAVDNERFNMQLKEFPCKKELRKIMGLPEDKRIFLFSGKYIPIKQPMQLLKAFHHSANSNSLLLFVGDGHLRQEMEEYIFNNKIMNVLLVGFINQNEISKYYSVSDVFVMCSKLDAWGLSVNEAMNFNLPLILSTQTCCSDDLLENNINGFSYSYDDEASLSNLITYFSNISDNKIKQMGRRSGEIIKKFNYLKIIEGIKQI